MTYIGIHLHVVSSVHLLVVSAAFTANTFTLVPKGLTDDVNGSYESPTQRIIKRLWTSGKITMSMKVWGYYWSWV